MFQHFFSDYLVKLQETNHQWWHDFEVNKAVVNSPLNKAMQEVNFEDTAKLFEQAANQPRCDFKAASTVVGTATANLAECCIGGESSTNH